MTRQKWRRAGASAPTTRHSLTLSRFARRPKTIKREIRGSKGHRFSSLLCDLIAKFTLLMAPCRISACIMAFKMHGSIGLSPTTKRQFCNIFLCRINRARASRSWSKKSSPDICPLHTFGGHALILAPIRRRWRLIGFNRKPAISGRSPVNGRDYGPQLRRGQGCRLSDTLGRRDGSPWPVPLVENRSESMGHARIAAIRPFRTSLSSISLLIRMANSSADDRCPAYA
jgi:hypothetical protein